MERNITIRPGRVNLESTTRIKRILSSSVLPIYNSVVIIIVIIINPTIIVLTNLTFFIIDFKYFTLSVIFTPNINIVESTSISV